MRLACSILLFILAYALTSCSSGQSAGSPLADYEHLDPGLLREIKALGESNWIVIADESFPLHSQRGIRTLVADKEIPEVVGGVLDAIDSTQHLRPIFYQYRKLETLDNETHPGVVTYRENLEKARRGFRPIVSPYRYLKVLLEEDAKAYTVLVIKTKTTLPYSTVFIHLDSGYWFQRSEEKLRSKMSSQGITTT